MNRDRFPAVMAAAAHGHVLADNAAGTQLPDVALERMQRYLAYDNAQKGAGFRRTSATIDLIDEAKREFARLIGTHAGSVGFGANATSIAMSFARLIAASIRAGDRIVVTAADHEANVAPWMWLRRFGAQIDVVPVNAAGDLDESKLRMLLAREPKLVALPWASNATGTIFDVARYAKLAKAAGAIVVVDGVQALPHLPLDIDEAVDFATFSAYKIYAPHFGFWYLDPSAGERLVRADDAHVPGGDARYWTLETGTQSHEALAGWLGTLAYLRDVAPQPREAIRSIAAYEAKLAAYACARFAERAEHVTLYGRPASESRLPLFAFNVNGTTSDELAERLDRANIEARVGDYYCPRLMGSIAKAAGGRAVRLSLAHYNTTEEIDRCFDVIDSALESNSTGAMHA